jgi:hypothetical protein
VKTTPLSTIEPLLCCLCGRGIEAGKMVGGRTYDMVHPDCLLIDPFAEPAEATAPTLTIADSTASYGKDGFSA